MQVVINLVNISEWFFSFVQKFMIINMNSDYVYSYIVNNKDIKDLFIVCSYCLFWFIFASKNVLGT